MEEELCDMAYGAEGRRAAKGYNTSSRGRPTPRDGRRACIRAPVSVPDIREVTCVARRIRSEYAGAVFFRRADQARARVRWTIGPSCNRGIQNLFLLGRGGGGGI